LGNLSDSHPGGAVSKIFLNAEIQIFSEVKKSISAEYKDFESEQ